MTPYQFALVRYLHKASAGELVNVGLVMWLPTKKRLLYSVNERYSRLSSFFQPFDGAGYRQLVRQLSSTFRDVSRELSGEIQLGLFSAPPETIDDILPRLLQDDASCFQWSTVMAGIASDPTARLKQLVAEMIERHESRAPRERRDENDIWGNVEQRLRQQGLAPRLQKEVEITGKNYTYRFKTGWQNGVRQVMEPISFDYLYAADVVEKANTWSGRLFNLANSADFQLSAVVAPPERKDLRAAYNQAIAILKSAPKVRRLLTEEEFEDFMHEIERDLESHVN